MLRQQTGPPGERALMEPPGRRISLHRCRFMDYEPRAVVAMAASASGTLLAVGRENGNVEIRRVREKLRVMEVVQVTAEDRLRAVAWSRDKADHAARLFVGSLDGTICEVDVYRMTVVRRQDSLGGPVWCMAVASKRDSLAVGCEDGSVKLFSTVDGELEYERTLPSGKGRVLSLAWQPDDAGLFVGAVDGTIRHVDPKTGHSKFRMTVESRNNLGATMVWALKVLPDGTLVSGDSLGSLHFWDGRMGTLQQSLIVHEADVTVLEAWSGDKGDIVFASGVDSKLVFMRRERASGSWALAASNRAHTHDVTGLAIVSQLRGRGGSLPVLLSGGKDTKICSYPVVEFATKRPRYIAPYPYQQVGSLACESHSRLFLMRHDRKLHLWRLAPDDPTALLHDIKPAFELQPPPDKGNIVCAAVSRDGKFMAYATREDTRVFAVYDDTSEIRVKSVGKGLLAAKGGVTAMEFVRDGKRLVAGTRTGVVSVVDLVKGDVVAATEAPDADYDVNRGAGVIMLSCNANGKHVAIHRFNGTVEVFDLTSAKELKSVWTLPRLDSPPTALAFHCSAPNILAVATVSNRFYLFDTSSRGLTEWSKDMNGRLPPELLDRKDCIVGICFNPGSPNSIMLYGFGFVCYVDLDRPPAQRALILPETHYAALQQRKALARRKRKRGTEGKDESEADVMVPHTPTKACAKGKGRGDKKERRDVDEDGKKGEETNGGDDTAFDGSAPWNVQMHLGYQGVLCVEAMGHNEVVLVEEPWIKIVDKLPDVLFRHRYGT